MMGRVDGLLLLQLGCLAFAEAQAIREDPDGKLKTKDGYHEFLRDDLARPLTGEEQAEVDRLLAHAARLMYLARTMGLVCNGLDHAFGGRAQDYGPWED
jgi:hypothetical protein